MAIRHRRRRRRRFRVSAGVLLLAGAAVCTWWLYRAERTTDAGWLVAQAPATPEPVVPQSASPPAAAPSPTPIDPPAEVPAPVIEKHSPAAPPISLVQQGREALARGDAIAARRVWSEALRLNRSGSDEAFLRTELARIAEDTILSPRIASDDPLVQRYVIQTGDVLAKIAAANKLTPDFLASINGIVDKNHIREGQSIKVVQGPFRAVVHKEAYTLDVFLGEVFVRQFSVGLGADDGTPTGEWRVGTKLVNPTYYPPRGGGIVSSDDPKNPLGERWIGLVGVSGRAVDQQRYGVHGTNEPESIGKSLSMGCIRLRNADVEVLYTYLVEPHSTVTVLE